MRAARADDDRPIDRQKPQLRSAAVNASRAIGADEVDGPTILEGVPAFRRLDGARDTLRDRYGIYFHGLYLGDPYANLDGGLRRGASYSGRLDVELDLDVEKVAGLRGGTLHANMFQIHGVDLSTRYIGNFLSTNDIGARPSTRLYEAWYEQRLGDNLTIRIGQQGSDVEFLTSNYAANFIDATFGWPGLPSQNLPDGGPAYPLATPAVRARLQPSQNLAILAAVFDGRPAGPCPVDPQICDPSGTNFRVSDPPLVIVEGQYRYNKGEDAAGLPGTLKVGGFGHFGRFEDQRFGIDGHRLASPSSVGMPILHSPNGGVYGILDQQVYRVGAKELGDDDDDRARGIGVFARLIGAPADRNPLDLYADAGVSAFGIVPSRPDDLFGVAAAFAKISGPASSADIDKDLIKSVDRPVRDFEAVVEVTYQAQIVPGLTIQPTFQYIFHPGGHVPLPTDPTRPLRDAKVFGATTAVRF